MILKVEIRLPMMLLRERKNRFRKTNLKSKNLKEEIRTLNVGSVKV